MPDRTRRDRGPRLPDQPWPTAGPGASPSPRSASAPMVVPGRRPDRPPDRVDPGRGGAGLSAGDPPPSSPASGPPAKGDRRRSINMSPCSRLVHRPAPAGPRHHGDRGGFPLIELDGDDLPSFVETVLAVVTGERRPANRKRTIVHEHRRMRRSNAGIEAHLEAHPPSGRRGEETPTLRRSPADRNPGRRRSRPCPTSLAARKDRHSASSRHPPASIAHPDFPIQPGSTVARRPGNPVAVPRPVRSDASGITVPPPPVGACP